MKVIVHFLFLALVLYACREDSGTFTDERDGNEYRWVKIGDDIWMAENLAYLPQVNSVFEGSYHDPMYYVYGYRGTDLDEAESFKILSVDDTLISPLERYGVLYNWAAIANGGKPVEGKLQGVCPAGWHVPTDEEWMDLEFELGLEKIDLPAIGLRSTNMGGMQLKAEYGWDNYGNGIDTVGFAALPGGEAFAGSEFYYEGEKATFWTASGTIASTAWIRQISCCESGIIRIERDKMDGYSLRCVKD